jgi:alanine-glyoxylate transaminase/serine-glyoxylate transaminase/serine-pyruvate transaminase
MLCPPAELRGILRLKSVRVINLACKSVLREIGSGGRSMAYFSTKPETGRHFLQIPGPTNVPDRVLRALDNAPIDHRGHDFGVFTRQLFPKLQLLFQTTAHVLVFPGSGTGSWEAALVNTCSPGDDVLFCRTGQFAATWIEMAKKLQLNPIVVETDWRHAADIDGIAAALRADSARKIKIVGVVHNETSTGCVTNIAAVRAAIDAVGHPALLLVDTVSGIGCLDYRHDEWGVDVSIAGSQKGMMLPPGLGFNAVSAKALEVSKTASMPRAYWHWQPMIKFNETGYFPSTPATNLLYALDAGLDMLLAEGLDNVFARHDRFAEATRRAVATWGFETQCADPAAASSVVTAIRLPEGHSGDQLRKIVAEKFDMSLGNGLGPLADKVFRIGHLGHLSALQLVGVIGGVEMGLKLAGIPHREGGVLAAMQVLAGN